MIPDRHRIIPHDLVCRGDRLAAHQIGQRGTLVDVSPVEEDGKVVPGAVAVAADVLDLVRDERQQVLVRGLRNVRQISMRIRRLEDRQNIAPAHRLLTLSRKLLRFFHSGDLARLCMGAGLRLINCFAQRGFGCAARFSCVAHFAQHGFGCAACFCFARHGFRCAACFLRVRRCRKNGHLKNQRKRDQYDRGFPDSCRGFSYIPGHFGHFTSRVK